jgi:predicted DNA-binding protein
MTEIREAVRVNSRISAEVNDWLDRRSKETGIPKSSIIHLALEQYMIQMRSITALETSQGTLRELADKVNRIEEKLSVSQKQFG